MAAADTSLAFLVTDLKRWASGWLSIAVVTQTDKTSTIS